MFLLFGDLWTLAYDFRLNHGPFVNFHGGLESLPVIERIAPTLIERGRFVSLVFLVTLSSCGGATTFGRTYVFSNLGFEQVHTAN